jgi:putative aldouronate transport system permease protein
MKKTTSDISFYFLVYLMVIFALIVTLYPFLYIVNVSLSSVDAINRKIVNFYPIGINLNGYLTVIKYPAIWTAYYNTVWYTVIGTIFNIVATCIAAYPLSRKNFFLRKQLNFFIAFTMYFSGGLIPYYVLISKLGLYNSRWVMVIPVLLSTFNVMICRSAFEGVSEEVFESAKIDGANDFKLLIRIAIPLIKPTLAVLTLYYAVSHWNEFFGALLFLGKTELQPLQIFLRRILVMASTEVMQSAGSLTAVSAMATSTLQIRYVCIVVAVLPIIMVYPFIQKYFVKGIMLGAVKG